MHTILQFPENPGNTPGFPISVPGHKKLFPKDAPKYRGAKNCSPKSPRNTGAKKNYSPKLSRNSGGKWDQSQSFGTGEFVPGGTSNFIPGPKNLPGFHRGMEYRGFPGARTGASPGIGNPTGDVAQASNRPLRDVIFPSFFLSSFHFLPFTVP